MPTHVRRKTQVTVSQLAPRLLAWFLENARDLPWRHTRDPYAIWISEIMLQQTQVKTVIPFWERWLRELPTVESLASASSGKIHKLWEGLGYYARVRNLQKAAQQIIAQHDGKFPESFDDILALPGIGRYTAGAISSIAFNQPRPILDGNVIRALTRIFGIATDPREKRTNARLWQLAEELVRHASCLTHHASPCSHLNQSLMELGALVCTPRSPNCAACPVKGYCVAFRDRKPEQFPSLGKRAKTTERRFLAFAIERKGRFLVRQRPEGVVNAHLWEFPNEEVGLQKLSSLRTASHGLGLEGSKMKLLCTIKHSITRYRITLEAWRANFGGPVSPKLKLTGRWLTPAQLEKLAFTSAHKKILQALRTDPTGRHAAA